MKTETLAQSTARAFRGAKPAAKPAAKPKKIHPADQLDRDAVLTASSFSTFFRTGPTGKITRPAETLALAIAASDNIVAELRLDGRKGKITPIIYAIQPDGAQSPVPADMIEEARAGRLTVDPRAMDRKAADASRLGSIAAAYEAVGAPTPAAAIVAGLEDKSPTEQPQEKPFESIGAQPLDMAAEVAKVAAMSDEEVKAATKANKAKRRAAVTKTFDEAAKTGADIPPHHNLARRNRAALDKLAEANAEAKPAPASSKVLGKRAQADADAAAGIIPAAPDFSAPSHGRFVKKLAEIVALVEAKDVAGLKAYPINPASSSRKAMDRYRNLAVVALEAQAAK